MPQPGDIEFDVASALIQGKRDVQEDALASNFQVGSDFGFVVLSDGMGGHEAGDVASNIVVTEIFSELKLQSVNAKDAFAKITNILSAAAHSANQCLHEHAQAHPTTRGMGATLVAPVFKGDRLHWISVGDSPLFLFRDGKLTQLNEDHSLAPQIDFMVSSGMLSESNGRDHPDRNCLTSALLGEEIPRIDCPEQPFQLRPGDLIIVASDGLQFLSDSQIQKVLAARPDASASEFTELLIAEIEQLDDPHQDNVSFAVIKVSHMAPAHGFHGAERSRPNGADPSPETGRTAANGRSQPATVGAISFLTKLRSLSSNLMR